MAESCTAETKCSALNRSLNLCNQAASSGTAWCSPMAANMPSADAMIDSVGWTEILTRLTKVASQPLTQMETVDNEFNVGTESTRFIQFQIGWAILKSKNILEKCRITRRIKDAMFHSFFKQLTSKQHMTLLIIIYSSASVIFYTWWNSGTWTSKLGNTSYYASGTIRQHKPKNTTCRTIDL